MVKQRKVSGGVYLKSDWRTDALPIEVLPSPPHVVIPLVHHGGTCARPCVKVGDRVAAGQLIGEPGEGAAAVHASVCGNVHRGRAIFLWEPPSRPGGYY